MSALVVCTVDVGECCCKCWRRILLWCADAAGADAVFAVV